MRYIIHNLDNDNYIKINNLDDLTYILTTGDTCNLIQFDDNDNAHIFKLNYSHTIIL